MILFLTSSPTGDLDGKYVPDGLDPRSGFLEEVRKVWRSPSRCLMITASPDCYAANDEMTEFFRRALSRSSLPCSAFDLWDGRTEDVSEKALLAYDVIFLGGGHVPTQNAFFRKIALREKLQGFGGIVIGISAGTMNCADTVYSSPEEPGEAIDPEYRRFFPGLGLTELNILPHYQVIRDDVLDGKKLFEEIVLPDSAGRRFLVLPDGSFVREENGLRQIFGEHRWIADGHWL